jgi:hypothetical protein
VRGDAGLLKTVYVGRILDGNIIRSPWLISIDWGLGRVG